MDSKIGVSLLKRYPDRRYIEVGEVLLDEDDPDYREWNLLRSVRSGDFYGVTRWLESGADASAQFFVLAENFMAIDFVAEDEEIIVTPLMVASYYGHVWIAMKLMDYHADPYFENNQGDTALIWAAYKGNDHIILALPLYDVELNKANSFGNTPLMAAAQGNNRNIAFILITYGADVKQENIRGESAITFATGKLKEDLITYSEFPYERQMRNRRKFFDEGVKFEVETLRVQYQRIRAETDDVIHGNDFSISDEDDNEV